jgi:hypothetical protein
MSPKVKQAVEDATKAIGPGCGDNSCEFVKPVGMATNGGCRCLKGGDGRSSTIKLRLKQLYKACKEELDDTIEFGPGE